MNSIDVENIKKELAKREAANYKWTEGGDMSKDDIMLRTTKELNQLITDFNNKVKNDASYNVKRIVDELFEKYGTEDDNMIVFSAAYVPERTTYECDEPLANINFDWREYNKLYLPICRDWEYYDNYYYIKDADHEDAKKLEKQWNEYDKDVERLTSEIYKIKGIMSAEEYWADDNDALNECWYGCIGIMKDYRVVAFVIRDDGMLCDEEGYETFHNSVICQL